jgi:hypothetical protein
MILALLIFAHSWYASECCANGDCHPVPCSEIVRADDRWLWKGIQPILGARPSEDSQCHACSHDDFHRTFLFCLYLPKVIS